MHMRVEFLHLCCTLYCCFLFLFFFFFKDHSFPYGSFSVVWCTFCGFGQMHNDKNTSLQDYTDYFHCPENYLDSSYLLGGFPGGANDKESACQCRRCKRCGFDSWVRKIPWKREWLPTPVFLPKESHGPRSLVSYNPQGRRVGHDQSNLAHTSYLLPNLCHPRKPLIICFLLLFSS